MKKRVFVGAFLLSVSAVAAGLFAQPGPVPGMEVKRKAMEQVAFLAGEWSGSGWMQIGPQRQSFQSSEVVVPKLDGLVLVIEGMHTAEMEPGQPPRVVHETLAFLSYDPNKNQYAMQTHLVDGRSGDYAGRVEDGAFIWEIVSPTGKMRYTIKLNEKGEWHEIGEMTRDEGKTWMQFFEMTLTKKAG